MSPVLDDRGRLGGKISVVDLLVLLLLVALGVFALTRYSSDTLVERPVTVKLTVEEIRDPTVVQFKKGDVIYEDTGARLGAIQKITVAPTTQEVPTADGGLVATPSPVFFDVDLELLGKGRVSKSSIEVGGRPVRVGKLIAIVGPGYEVRVRVSGAGPAEE